MATVIVNTTAGKTMAQKRAVIAEITDTVEKHFKLPRGVIRVYVNEVARTNVADGGVIERKCAISFIDGVPFSTT